MQGLIERVARALVPVLSGSQEDEWGNDLPSKQYDDISPDWQVAYQGYARAAIAEVFAYLERDMALTALCNDEAPKEWIDGFDTAKGRLAGLRNEVLGE